MHPQCSIRDLKEKLSQRLRSVSPLFEALHPALVHFAPSLEEEETVQRFVEGFDAHVALQSRLIEAGRVAAFNPAQRRVDSLATFFRVLGLTNAKQVATSLLLSEVHRSSRGEWLEEDVKLCLLGGLLGREIVAREGSCDVELGWVCALLRSAGRLMMGRILESDPRQAQLLSLAMHNDDITTAAMGIAPATLAYHLWRVRALPDALLMSLDAMPSYLITTSAFTHEDELLMWTDLALRLSGAVLQCGDVQSFSLRLGEFLEQESATHNLQAPDVQRMISRAMSQLPALFVPGSASEGVRSVAPASGDSPSKEIPDRSALTVSDASRLIDY